MKFSILALWVFGMVTTLNSALAETPLEYNHRRYREIADQYIKAKGFSAANLLSLLGDSWTCFIYFQDRDKVGIRDTFSFSIDRNSDFGKDALIRTNDSFFYLNTWFSLNEKSKELVSLTDPSKKDQAAESTLSFKPLSAKEMVLHVSAGEYGICHQKDE